VSDDPSVFDGEDSVLREEHPLRMLKQQKAVKLLTVIIIFRLSG